MVLSMERWVDKVAIVTASNSRVGSVIVEKLVEAGLKVVGLARRIEQLAELFGKLQGKKGKFYPIKADVTRERDIVDVFKWSRKNLGPIHILVNNGGIHVTENLYNGQDETFEKTLDVNVNSLCIATREAIKAMRKNDVDGHIIHINSIVGYRITTSNTMDIYPAAKHAVTALTETLRLELNALKSRIKVTSINPGCAGTPAFDLDTRKSELFQQLTTENILEAKDIADTVVYALSTPPHVQIQELTIKPLNEV